MLEGESGTWGLSFGSIPVWSPAEDLPLWGSSFHPCRMKRLTLEFQSPLKFYSQSPSSRYEANTDGSIVCKREFSHQSCQEGTPGDPGSPPRALVRSQTTARKLSLERPKLGRQVSPWVCGMHMCVCVCVCVCVSECVCFLLHWDVHVHMCMSACLLKPKEIKAIFHAGKHIPLTHWFT